MSFRSCVIHSSQYVRETCEGKESYTVCGYWVDAVRATGPTDKVDCEPCLRILRSETIRIMLREHE